MESADTITTSPRGSVWVVTIDLAYPIVAVGSTKAKALLSASIRAARLLNDNGYVTADGGHWHSTNLSEQFCVNVTQLDIDGPGAVENCSE